MPQTHQRAFPTDPNTLLQATRTALSNLKWRIDTEDPTTWRIFATTKVSFWSWGENLELQISNAQDGSVLTAVVRLKLQLFGWGIQARRATTLFDEVARALGPAAPPSSPPVG